MTLGAKEALGTVGIHGGAIEKTKHAAHLVVKSLGAILAFLYSLDVRYGQVIVIISILGALIKAVGPRTELHVKSVLHCLIRVMSTSPVTYHHTVKLPVALQDFVESPLIVAIMLVLIDVVSTHDGP